MTPPKRIRQPLSGMGQFMCSIVGTCLTLKETEKIARRCGYSGETSPYQLHTWAVEACQKAPAVAKQFQKYLTGKYRLTMNRVDAYAGEDLDRAWQEAVREGRVAGAYWAILTRVDAPAEVMARVFGEVHMMSHLQGSEVRAEFKELDSLRQDNHCLQEHLNRLLARLGMANGQREALRRRLSEQEGELSRARQRLHQTEKNLLALTQGEAPERLKKENQVLLQQLAAERRTREKLELRLMQAAVRQLPQLNRLPAANAAAVDPPTPAPEICPCGEGAKCPRFCNKFILFVGGLERLEPHYRSLVEKEFGARFLRHDGDCRNGQDRLIHMVKRAEAVICPLNCNSHSASLCVKKVCKDLNKPCVLLRNSGLGTLKRSLFKLAAAEPEHLAMEA